MDFPMILGKKFKILGNFGKRVFNKVLEDHCHKIFMTL